MRDALLGDCGCGRGDLGAVAAPSSAGLVRTPTKVVNAALYKNADRSDDGWIVPAKGTVLLVGKPQGKVVPIQVPPWVQLWEQDGEGGLRVANNPPPQGTMLWGNATMFATKTSGMGGWWLLLAGAAYGISRR